jgi:hypothetical protein
MSKRAPEDMSTPTPISVVESQTVFLALRMIANFEVGSQSRWSHELGREAGETNEHAIEQATQLLVLWGWVTVTSGPEPGLGHAIVATEQGMAARGTKTPR